MNQMPIQDSAQSDSVCVVIPTLGRRSLRGALDSVLRQTRKPRQVVIVNDAQTAIDLETDASGVDLRIVEGEGRGASAARNRGVIEAVADWIAFLDDDDVWRPQKLEKQLQGHSHRDDVLLSCGARVHIGSSQRLRPRKWFSPDLDVLAAFYGKRSFQVSKFYLPTPSFVVPSRIAREVPFDETLSVREDIWWLHQLQVSGIEILQRPAHLLDVHTSLKRNNEYNSEEAQLRWAMKLESWNSRFAIHYLRGMATRDALIAAKPMQALRMLRAGGALARTGAKSV